MAGVRVQHPTARSVRFTVVESDRPYLTPYQCTAPEFGGCGTTHLFKTHHLNLDDTGAVIVGDKLYEKIKGLLALNSFSETNVVAKPPTMGIGVGAHVPGSGSWGNIPILRGRT
jgi:hypothetical protein